ncbi:hypothetical protein E8E11_002706 [Didymella keratinophila]|nr:hypothetical protein E8E11_002706 [Didymella keratinophila]
MEVNAESFPNDILGLLINISEADFVSFDLLHRYAETKEGADRYQILQVGLTCAKFDFLANKYVLRPYNINISPLFDERLDFEREISFQSGACSFLLGCGFDLGLPFAQGVQYLSREEAERAKKLAYDRIDKKNVIEDLQLKSTDIESLDFVRRCRDAITAWQKSTSTNLEITSSTGLPNASASCTISRFEKRLVHQLVRAEFPDAVAIGRNDCIRIMPFDAVREADNTRRIKTRVKEQIARQTGFRWIFEALVGGDINNDLLYILRSNGPSEHRDRFDRASARLKKHRPVIVGHNMFTDIVYLYRTFVGPLPDTLEAFNEKLHELCPRIVDTKYLATHDEGDLNASPTLEEIAKGLQKQHRPTIVTHEDHAKYNGLEAFHEAGYDSLLTATIMLRLAAKLGAEHHLSCEPTKQNGSIAQSNKHGEAAKPALGREASEGGIKLTSDVPEDFIADGCGKVQSPVDVPPVEANSTTTGRKNRKAKRKNKKKEEQTAHRFATQTVFEKLRELSVADAETSDSTEEEGQGPELDHDALNGTGDDASQATGSWTDEEYVQDESGWVPIPKVERRKMEMIPDFGAQFWETFGNKLRVFGTTEREMRIAEWPGAQGQ